MRIINKIITAVFAIIFLCNCAKKHDYFNTYFYTDKLNGEGELRLFLDDSDVGPLPVLNVRLICENDSTKNKALLRRLKSGKYKLAVKNLKGETKSEGTVKFSKSSVSSSGGIGGQEISISGDCAIVRLFE
jgi:hypothetical protein